MINAKIWLHLARFIAPEKRAEWLRAMEAEMSSITEPKQQSRFAFGCFQSLAADAVRSRKGLSYMARFGGATFIIASCAYGIWNSGELSGGDGLFTASSLITGLCLFYLIAAALLIFSLRGLKIYAAIGAGAAVSAWTFITVTSPAIHALPMTFLQAICLEMTGFMIGLFLASLYLNWLHSPKVNHET